MNVSVRSALLAGVASLSAVVITVPSAPQVPVERHQAPIALMASVEPQPKAPSSTVLTRDDKPVSMVVAQGPGNVALVPLAAPPGEVGVQNVASDVIDTVYSFTRYWANYAALYLAPWALGFIPFGWIATDQINIWYNNFVLPVVDSFVYDFLIPVVNNPLNPVVWIDGIADIAVTAVNGVIGGLVDEVYWAWSLLPLPPLPPWPFAATELVDDAQLRTMALDESLLTDPLAPEELTEEPLVLTEEIVESPELVEQEFVETDVLDDDLLLDEIVTDEVIGDDVITDEVTELDETTEETEEIEQTEEETEVETELEETETEVEETETEDDETEDDDTETDDNTPSDAPSDPSDDTETD